MKLLEPLSGVKTAQGHALVHLLFFIAMCFVTREAKIEHAANSVEYIKTIDIPGELPVRAKVEAPENSPE